MQRPLFCRKSKIIKNVRLYIISDQLKSIFDSLSELKELEYYTVYVKGHFIHDKELYMGPRSLLHHGDASSQGGLMSKNQSKNTGYLVVTPFKLADREYVFNKKLYFKI